MADKTVTTKHVWAHTHNLEKKCVNCGAYKDFEKPSRECTMTKPRNPDNILTNTIQDWHEAQIVSGLGAPDFWDEHDTSERLARFLISRGWKHDEH